MFKEFRTLLPYLREYRLKYLAGFLFLALTDAGQLVIPQIVKLAIDAVSTGSGSLPAVLRLCALLIALALFVAIGRFGWRYFIHGSSRRIEASLRERLFAHLVTLSSSFYGRNRTGDLMARITNDTNAVRMATGMALVAFADGVFMSGTILVILFASRPSLALATVLPLPVVTLLVIGSGRLTGPRFKRVQEQFAALSTHVQEAVSGIRVLKAFVQERRSLAGFEDANDEYRRRSMSLMVIWGLFDPVVMFLSGMTTLILLAAGGRAVLSGTLSPGEFVATLSYLGMLIWPMLGAGYTVNMLQRGAASLGRINEVLGEKPSILNRPGALKRTPGGTIEIRNLSFTYPGASVPALEAVGFTLPKGSILGILGRTGAGKSTLVKLLPRLLDPPAGTVFLDGVDVRDYDLETLRRAFGFVPQDTFLFSDTIRNNIAFADPGASDGLIREVADISTIGRDLALFPDGILTEVGERGLTLSGGQKQRIAISRALAVKPGILVFDDALSSVDTETEEKILRGILGFRNGKTTIIISHRVSTLKEADHILVLDGGKLVEEGTHAELVGRDGFYAEINALQQPARGER